MSSPRSRTVRRSRRLLTVLLATVMAALAPLIGPLTPAASAAATDASGAGMIEPGYWLVASDGGVFSHGNARFLGSTGAIHLNQPITGMAPTPSGNGYWLTASDGGIFAFGDAGFFGSTGAVKLNKPITGMAPTPSGNGYWLTASDGGVFTFGDAAFHGAAPSRPTNGPRAVVAIVPTATGAGYWQASTTGELLAFGDAADLGGETALNRPIVALAAMPAGLSVTGAMTEGASTGDTVSGLPNSTPPATTKTSPPGTSSTTTTTSTSNTTTSTSTTTTTVPPYSGPRTFSSTAAVTWGTIPDPNRSGYAQLVEAIVEVGDRVFVAGEFTNIADPSGIPAGPSQPFLVALDVNTGAPVAGSRFNATANPDGPVYALSASADGRRLYVGGKFTTIGGRVMRRLAALDVDTGLVDPTFNPPTPSAYVNAIEPSQGRLYVGGAFSTLNASGTIVNRPQLAALDAASGALVNSFVPPPNYGGVFETHTGKPVEDQPGSYNPGVVGSLAVTADGATIMVGGNFLHFGTAPADDPNHQHGGLIALDTATGALSSWQPVSKRPVFGLTVWPGDGKTIFAAAGGAGGVVQAFKPGGSASPKWTGHVDGDARDVAATSERVYLVGHYDYEVPNAKDPCLQYSPQPPDGHLGISCPNGEPHRHLAAFDAKTGNVDPSFTAQADTNEGPTVAYIGAKNLYVGGNFMKVSDTPQANYRAQRGLAVYPATS